MSHDYGNPLELPEIKPSVKTKICTLLVPDMTPNSVLKKIRDYFDDTGLREAKVRLIAGYKPFRSRLDADVVQAALKALDAHNAIPTIYPSLPGIGPMSLLTEALRFNQALWCGMGHGARYHSENEYITVDGIIEGIKYYVTLLYEYANI